MKQQLLVEADCGETTCASEPGHFCPYLLTSGMGSRWHCQIFDRDADLPHGWRDREERDGWVQRAPECLASRLTRNSRLLVSWY